MAEPKRTCEARTQRHNGRVRTMVRRRGARCMKRKHCGGGKKKVDSQGEMLRERNREGRGERRSEQ